MHNLNSHVPFARTKLPTKVNHFSKAPILLERDQANILGGTPHGKQIA